MTSLSSCFKRASAQFFRRLRVCICANSKKSLDYFQVTGPSSCLKRIESAFRSRLRVYAGPSFQQ
jgi:hypothetical protein